MLDALTLDQMRNFVAVVEAGSFRAAATRLSRAQSAVSHAISNLEGQLGVTLFDRSGHRPTLTPEGHALLADARAILLKVDTMRARATGLGEGLELALGIALDPQFPLSLAAAALKDLHDAYPSVSVRLWSAPLGARSSPFARAVHSRDHRSRDPVPGRRAGGAIVRASRCGRRRDSSAGRPLRVRGAPRGRRPRGLPADRGPRSLTADRGPGLRRTVSRNLARKRQRAKRALILAGVGWEACRCR